MPVKVLDWIISLWGPEETARGKMTRWDILGLGHIQKSIVKHARRGKETLERDSVGSLNKCLQPCLEAGSAGRPRRQRQQQAAAAAAAGQPGFPQLQTAWLQAHLPVPWA